MPRIRVLPRFRGGKDQGWKVFAIRPNSIFAQVGPKKGNVIQSVNGRELDSPTKVYQAFQQLRDANHIEVELTRRGRHETLRYEIR
jgi:type II secretory pathway component PulC